MKKISYMLCVPLMMAMASCSETNTKTTTGDADTAVLKADSQVTPVEREVTNWDKVDFTSPIVQYKEITSKDIDVRGNESYSIYSVNETLLFSTGSVELRNNAKAGLGEVCASIGEHYPQGKIRVYGYADSVGESDDNKKLSKERAEAVKNYLVGNCRISEDKISVVAEGESKPAASNATERGRQQNRRVRIVAMK